MSNTLADILCLLTKPMSKDQVDQYIAERHGTDTVIDSVSSDVTALDSVGQKALMQKAK
jgi:hypothetical protein